MTLATKKCKPCGKGAVPLTAEKIQNFSKKLPKWQVEGEPPHIRREFKFDNYTQSLAFVNKVSDIAEAEGHHPDIVFGWGYVRIKLSTHSIGGLHENDFIIAAKIDTLV